MESSSSEELSQSLSDSQYDAQTVSEDWTLLSDNEDMEPVVDSPETAQSSPPMVTVSAPDTTAATASHEAKTSTEEIDNECNHKNERQINDNTGETSSGEHSAPALPDTTNSDIDIIDEDELDDSSDDELSTASLCSSSVVSQTSNLSFLRDQYLRQQQLLSPDFNTEDLSETSSLNYRELATDVELKRGTRAYVHTPNTGLNGKLNLILILSLSTVVGLGIGNFIGWSNHWKQHKQVSLGQVLKLKQLQDELVVCMQNQVNKGSQLEGQSAQICYSDNDYFRGKFETLFSENKGLLDALQRTQQHYHSDGDLKNIIAVKDCDNKSASDEFHKLKLGLLVNQMEHLHLLKTLEEVKYKGQQSEKRVKDLEVENSELKMKLVEEEEDDEVIVQSWGSRVALLETENQELKTRLVEDEEEDSVVMARLNARIGELVAENQELKAAINQLEVQVVNVGHNPASAVDTNGYSNARVIDTETPDKVPIKLDLLKQRINQMVIENDELKSTIARLRWTSHDQMIVDEDSDPLIDEEIVEEEEESSPEYESQESSAEEMEQLERQLNELRDMLSTEQMESKKWRQMYESLKTTKSDDNIDKTPNKDNQRSKPSKNKPKETADNDNILFDWVLNSTSLFKDAVRKGSAVFSDRFQELYNKVMTENESIIPLEVFNGLNLTQTVITDLNRRLANKWHELQDLRTVFTAGNEKISAKMSRLYAQTVRKLHDAKHKLLSKEESVRSKVDQFSARMSRLVDKMDAKWNQLLAKLSKRYGQQPSAEKSGRQSAYDQTGDEYEPKINWFFERANSRRQQPYKTTDRLDRTVRVNVNSRHRVLKGDLYSDVDSGDDVVDNDYDGSDGDSSGAEEAEDVNWFLKERRKPRMESDYSFSRPVSANNARYHRRMKFRSNGRFESSTSHRIHHHYRQR